MPLRKVVHYVFTCDACGKEEYFNSETPDKGVIVQFRFTDASGFQGAQTYTGWSHLDTSSHVSKAYLGLKDKHEKEVQLKKSRGESIKPTGNSSRGGELADNLRKAQ